MGQNADHGGTFETLRHDGESVSETVVRALAAAGIDTMGAETVIYDAIDLGALDRLFSSASVGDPTDRLVAFTAFDRRVHVFDDVRVSVTLLED